MEKLLNFFIIVMNKLISSQLFLWMMGVLCIVFVFKLIGDMIR